jgi:hypothetical protein
MYPSLTVSGVMYFISSCEDVSKESTIDNDSKALIIELGSGGGTNILSNSVTANENTR